MVSLILMFVGGVVFGVEWSRLRMWKRMEQEDEQLGNRLYLERKQKS
jgi:hypothetical protein